MGRQRYAETKVTFGQASVPVAADEIKTSNMIEHSRFCFGNSSPFIEFYRGLVATLASGFKGGLIRNTPY